MTMKREGKIGIIITSMIVLIVVGFIGWNFIDENRTYSMRELTEKYPTTRDLKNAVDSGEIDYNKLPDKAKKFLMEYDPSKDITSDDTKFIEGLK